MHTEAQRHGLLLKRQALNNANNILQIITLSLFSTTNSASVGLYNSPPRLYHFFGIILVIVFV
jgi:hypothetical protein